MGVSGGLRRTAWRRERRPSLQRPSLQRPTLQRPSLQRPLAGDWAVRRWGVPRWGGPHSNEQCYPEARQAEGVAAELREQTPRPAAPQHRVSEGWGPPPALEFRVASAKRS